MTPFTDHLAFGQRLRPGDYKDLTLPDDRQKSNVKVREIPATIYRDWRRTLSPPQTFHEGGRRDVPSEALLQAVWAAQRLRRDQLKTVRGLPVLVLHPGFWNREAGPDFLDALVQIGQDVKRGDIEVDLFPVGWREHRHDTNPDYARVILHVVWEARAESETVHPVLPLEPVLEAPIAQLEPQLRHETMPWTEFVRGRCAAPLAALPQATRSDLLRQAAAIRLEEKALRYRGRAAAVGWRRALWEGLFAALGYKQNSWPMSRLAEILDSLFERTGTAHTVLHLQALLFGLSGLLPGDPRHAHPSAASYLRNLWDVWWRERGALEDLVLPTEAWRLHGVRPANHPQRRLALAAHWIAEGALPKRIESWLVDDRIPDSLLIKRLAEVVSVPEDPFWSRHWTLRSRPHQSPQPLLGPQRLTDLAVNVVLPWLWARSDTGGSEELRARVEHRYFAWPASEDNSRLRLARSRLMGTEKLSRQGAWEQQGLLQILLDFCSHSNALCERCQFPELVQSLGV